MEREYRGGLDGIRMVVRIRARRSSEVSVLTPETRVGRQSSDRWRRCSKRRPGGKVDVRGGSWGNDGCSKYSYILESIKESKHERLRMG